MNIEEITGGVSPLKRKWKGTASRGSGGQKRSISGKMGGSAGIRNTQTKSGKKRRGGFSKTGAKGSNVHGYGLLTRFKPITSKAGPLAPATSTKTGPSTNGGGGDGGNTTNTYNYGDDYRDYSDKSKHLNYSPESNVEINEGDMAGGKGGAITNETNTEVIKKDKIDVDQKNINKTKQEIKTKEKTFMSIWSNNEKGVQGKYKNFKAFKKSAIAWNNSSAGKKYWANKNKTKQSNESEIDASQNLEDVGNIETGNQDASGGSATRGDTKVNVNQSLDKDVVESFFNSPNNYDPAKRSPNKLMKSHAWEMLQKQKKSRGGTQKY